MRHIDESKLAGSIDESVRLDRKERRHLGGCTVCTADLDAYVQVRQSLLASRSESARPDPQLVDQILAAVAADRARFGLPGRRAVYAGGLAVAAGLTGAVLFGRQKSKAA